ncbi:MAG: radical SAM protein [Nitrososphaerota archaeon]
MTGKRKEETLAKKEKRREAALKAWQTIRRKEAEKIAKSSRKIADFIHPKIIASITHPEVVLKEPIRIPPRIEYGHGIVKLFAKTPPDIACGPFWELRWAFGCPFDCSYCYLRGTNRGNMKPRFVKVRHILDALDEVFNDPYFNGGKPALFNSGELSDSLMNPSLMSEIVDKFGEQRKHKLVLLSKAGVNNVKFLLNKPDHVKKQVICAWSINAIEVAKMWERAAAPPEQRIQAAKMVYEVGYEVRVRIDPIFPIEDWETCYRDILYEIISEIEPTKIILGTPRGLKKTIYYARKAGADMSWTKFFKEDTGWGKKLPFELRKTIYEWFIDELDMLNYGKDRISICKETVLMLEELGIAYELGTCNCYFK